MKWQSLIAASAIAAMTLAGCSSGNSEGTSESSGTTASGEGTVYYLNFKPESDQAWQDLAKKYTEETGVEVKVVTAASGNYETTLLSEMGKSGAPTLFNVNGPTGLKNWKDYCYNLYGTPVYDQLINPDMALTVGDDDVAAIPYTLETYGIIVNKKLLSEAGYNVDDIKSYADLEKVATDIADRSSELGFTAFTSAGLDSSSYWRFTTHLANMPLYFEFQDKNINTSEDIPTIDGTYLDNYRDIFDLYVANATVPGAELAAKTADDSRNEFLNGAAVFYQNGSWEYSNLVTADSPFTADDLTMIPIYIGAGDEEYEGLATGTENYWCVNKDAGDANIQATLDFMYWCVTSDEGTTAMADDMGLDIPYKDAKAADNVFIAEQVEKTAEGYVPVAWDFVTIPSEQWKTTLATALTAYAADPTDANWEAVRTAFVDGWATEYQLANQGY